MLYQILSLLCGCCFAGDVDYVDADEVPYDPNKGKKQVSPPSSDFEMLGSIVPASWTYTERFNKPFMRTGTFGLIMALVNFDKLANLGTGVCGHVKRVGTMALKRIDLSNGAYIAGEIYCLTRLQHKSIMHAIHSVTEKNVLHLFLPICIPLTKLLNHGNARVAFLVLQGVSEGLKFLHDRFIVHGDLKPENFFLYETNGVLGDFGLTTPARSKSFLRKGIAYTDGFRAPECEHWSVYCEYSDVYAMGKSFEVFQEDCLSTPNALLSNLTETMTDDEEDDRPLMEEVIDQLEDIEEELDESL